MRRTAAIDIVKLKSPKHIRESWLWEDTSDIILLNKSVSHETGREKKAPIVEKVLTQVLTAKFVLAC